VEHRVAGPAHLVLDQTAAGRTTELPELHRVVDEALRIADQRVGGLDGPVEAAAVQLVVLVHRTERLAAA